MTIKEALKKIKWDRSVQGCAIRILKRLENKGFKNVDFSEDDWWKNEFDFDAVNFDSLNEVWDIDFIKQEIKHCKKGILKMIVYKRAWEAFLLVKKMK